MYLWPTAPTSAGKTFISFYAMEKVLRESDDGILVYVAPTKALVTQVAAEIYARFSKTVANGKSPLFDVWRRKVDRLVRKLLGYSHARLSHT